MIEKETGCANFSEENCTACLIRGFGRGLWSVDCGLVYFIFQTVTPTGGISFVPTNILASAGIFKV